MRAIPRLLFAPPVAARELRVPGHGACLRFVARMNGGGALRARVTRVRTFRTRISELAEQCVTRSVHAHANAVSEDLFSSTVRPK